LVIDRRLGVPLENAVVVAEPFRASSWFKPQIEPPVCSDIEFFSATKEGRVVKLHSRTPSYTYYNEIELARRFLHGSSGVKAFPQSVKTLCF
jgi:hypothetical protein